MLHLGRHLDDYASMRDHGRPQEFVQRGEKFEIDGTGTNQGCPDPCFLKTMFFRF